GRSVQGPRRARANRVSRHATSQGVRGRSAKRTRRTSRARAPLRVPVERSRRAARAPRVHRRALEREAQAHADLARTADDREVISPGIARIESAVDVELVGQVLAPDFDTVLAVRWFVDEATVQDAVAGLEHGLAVRVDQRSLISRVPSVGTHVAVVADEK